MSWVLRAGRVLLVVAVIFFLAATAALAGAGSSAATRGPDAHRAKQNLRMPTEWVTTPATLLKETALFRTRIQRIGESALVGFGVDLLTRSIQWLRQLGLARVEPHGGSTAGGV
jgi:hypothetical protein